MPKKPKATQQSLEQDWEKLGYTVESFYDEEGKGGRVFRPKQQNENSQPQGKSELVQRLMARLTALPRIPDKRVQKILKQLQMTPFVKTRTEELIQRYDTIIDFLVKTLKTSGPIRPQEYAEIYRTTELDKIYQELMGTGSFRLCKECNKILSGQQKSYCGQVCKKTFLSRQYREEHPELKLKRK